MAWEIQYKNGVWLPQLGWWLDAHFPAPRSFVSHAHFDHLAPHAEVLCSEGTARLMRARMPSVRQHHTLPFGRTEALTADASVTLYPAGHIFGSAQCLIEHSEHGRLLYTGDFKLRAGRSAERCETPKADVLIMETTYGRSHYVLPPTEKVLAEITRFCVQTLEDNETPVLFGYSLGKSQELLSSMAEARLPVMLHPQTLKMTQVYEELGIAFPPHREFSETELAGHVVICPPQAPQSPFLRKIPRHRTATITGWALDPGTTFRSRCDAAFPLSDHADFNDLLRMVELVQPQRVLTLHGFASDFARTLRERGVEAWAINQDNQLEMPLSGGSVAKPSAPPAKAGPTPVSPEPAPSRSDAFALFAAVAEQVRGMTGKSDKVARLSAYLASLPTEDAAHAALFFTGKPFARADDRTLNLGWAVIRRAVLEVTGLNTDDFRRTYLQTSDSGETAEVLLTGRTQPAPCSLAAIANLLAELAGLRGAVQKLSRLEESLRRLTPVEAKYLVKIITGDLRIGLKEGLVEEAMAAASGQTAEAIREAVMLSGDVGAVMRAAREGALAGIEFRIFHPIAFMLASPEPTAAALLERLTPPVWLEEKYDGIRCQVHTSPDRAELFSRDLHCITGQFPELAAAARELGEDAVIDGELLAWSDGRALPFAELQRRLGRKGDDFFLGAEIPVSVSCYDLLYHRGESLLKLPLEDRRARLEALLAPRTGRRALPFLTAPVRPANTVEAIEAAFLAARARGNEGLMAKDPKSPYTPGRRGLAWLKLKKAYATLDVVVVAVEYGHGKRRGVLSDYTFAVREEATGRLLTVGKAYSGLTDAEIARFTEHFLNRTLEVKGRRRSVVPDVVLEVAFDLIQPSERHPSGFALRFPRIVRIREDKTVAEIDTLDTCRKLAADGTFTPHNPGSPDLSQHLEAENSEGKSPHDRTSKIICGPTSLESL